jgi:hydrogenase maturation protein HypF
MMDEVMKKGLVARSFTIKGVVQGIGFRPFVYRLALHYGLKGKISNTTTGVSLHVEGIEGDIDSFSRDLHEKRPPLAYITEISSKYVPIRNFKRFAIARSIRQNSLSTLISPDISICDDCLREMLDPGDRRYRYPFINCTNCGPRYTIINNIPYDRPYTSMERFTMCASCRTEYEDPGNRRFHAQPNACWECGPQVGLYDNHHNKSIETTDPVRQAIKLVKKGKILAMKGLGGFHLVADAENGEAVSLLRERKRREEKPFAIMSYDVEKIRRYAYVEPAEEELLTSVQRPIVLLRKRRPNQIAENVAPRNNYFGVMLPYTPLHYLLLQDDFIALVMTSGNIRDEPIAVKNDEAFDRLSDIADIFLIHNRDIYLRNDDSITRRAAGATRVLRRSRGYVPMPVFLKDDLPPVLACGAELKNTVCLAKGDKAYLSQHIGDLENLSSYEFFQMTISHLKKILRIDPEIIAYDLHPDYLSTRYAEKQKDIRKIQVQHHHAHIVSCMAENGLRGDVIGLSFDGTGYGSDGRIWGGELLVADEKGFSRAASLSYMPMPGGTAAIKEPWRMAISYLYDAYGEGLRELGIPVIRETGEKGMETIIKMISNGINSPLTSSLGRLFDGIAAIIGLRSRVYFEGQAAMELEMAADQVTDAHYNYEWEPGEYYRIMPRPVVRGVVEDFLKGIGPYEISAKFHCTLIRLFSDICEIVSRERDIKRVVMSGGVFQNAILLAGLTKALEDRGLQVFSHRVVPTNDGGICLGQAMAAAAIMRG